MSNQQQQPFTLRAALGAPMDPPPLDPASTLVVIDVQAEYEPGGILALPDHAPALANIFLVLEAARASDTPIIHIAHQGSPGGAFDPASGGKISAQASPAEDELIIPKTLPNAFAGTELHQELQKRKPSNLVLVGFMTHMCLSSTARAALDLGYTTTVVSDASATRSLPSPTGDQPVSAQDLHASALAALADRFSLVTTTAHVLAAT